MDGAHGPGYQQPLRSPRMSLDIFVTDPYFQRILATALLVSAAAAMMGVFLVQRGMALFGDGVAHMSFAGIAIGFLTGWLPLAMAMIVGVVGALAVQQVQRRGWARSDAALGIVYTSSLAAGVVIASKGGSLPRGLESYLFGNLLLAGQTEFLVAAAAAVVVALTLVVLWRPFLLLSFGEERARVQGLPTAALSTIFTVLAAITVIALVRVVGVLLVSGLLVIPAAAANRLARSMGHAVILAVIFGAMATVLGLAASGSLGLASGATITLAAALIFAVSSLLPARA